MTFHSVEIFKYHSHCTHNFLCKGRAFRPIYYSGTQLFLWDITLLWTPQTNPSGKPQKIQPPSSSSNPEGSPPSQKKRTLARWFKVTFSSPSWRSLNPLKGSLNHPKKVTLNHQGWQLKYFWYFHPYLGTIGKLRFFQLGWFNHQLETQSRSLRFPALRTQGQDLVCLRNWWFEVCLFDFAFRFRMVRLVVQKSG